jgi:hypothetical protein
MAFGLFNNAPLKYTGVPFYTVPFIARGFSPTQNDWQNFSLGCIWLNQKTQAVFILVSLDGNQATWVQFISGTGDVQTLTSNTGGVVTPTAGNINVVGDGTTITGVGNTGTSTITLSVTGPASNGEVLISSASGAPIWHTLTAGSGVSITEGSNTITIAATGVGDVTGLETDDTNIVTPTAGVIRIAGGTGIVTTGTSGPNTVTISTTGTSTFDYKNVAHTDSPYTVLSTDEYLSVDCSGGVVTLNFPNAATLGRSYIVKDRTGNAATNNITITTPGGSVTFDGSTSFVMNTNFEACNILGNGSNWEIW